MPRTTAVHLRFIALAATVMAVVWLSVPMAVYAADSDPAATALAAEKIEFGDALASVNGILIERSALEKAFARVVLYSGAADKQTLAFDILNQLIEGELIRQFAEESDIVIAEADIGVEIDELKVILRDASWDVWLASNLYTEDEFRSLLHQQFINGAVRERVTAHLAGAVEHVHARHILVERESDARWLIDQLAAGASFGALAALYSRDVTTSDYGGDLGWFVRGELLDESLSDAAFSQAIGEMGGPIATRLGYHVLQVLDLAMRPIEEARLPYVVENIFILWLEDQVEAAEIIFNVEALSTLGQTTP